MIRCSYVLHCECSLLVDFVDFASGQWTCGQTDRPTETRLAGWLADKQTDRGTGKHVDRQIRTAVCFIGCHKISTSILFICLASTTTKYKEPLDCCWPAREREREKGSLDSWLKLCVYTRGWRRGEVDFFKCMLFQRLWHATANNETKLQLWEPTNVEIYATAMPIIYCFYPASLSAPFPLCLYVCVCTQGRHV